jgi:hypothetical protein
MFFRTSMTSLMVAFRTFSLIYKCNNIWLIVQTLKHFIMQFSLFASFSLQGPYIFSSVPCPQTSSSSQNNTTQLTPPVEQSPWEVAWLVRKVSRLLWSFITAFTIARHRSVSWQDESSPQIPTLSLRSILIESYQPCLVLRDVFYLQDFQLNFLYAFFIHAYNMPLPSFIC